MIARSRNAAQTKGHDRARQRRSCRTVSSLPIQSACNQLHKPVAASAIRSGWPACRLVWCCDSRVGQTLIEPRDTTVIASADATQPAADAGPCRWVTARALISKVPDGRTHDPAPTLRGAQRGTGMPASKITNAIACSAASNSLIWCEQFPAHFFAFPVRIPCSNSLFGDGQRTDARCQGVGKADVFMCQGLVAGPSSRTSPATCT